ncbi:MAG: HlyD family type I secretion periplasmic adaptor subunit [Gammaproteobacteria bacterium]
MAEAHHPEQGPAATASADAPRPALGVPLLVGQGIIALFFGLFLGWALFAPLDSAAIAPGSVSVDSKRKTIQHLEGGIIGRIHVRDGDTVEAGSILIHLDETQPRANLDLLRKRHDVTLAHIARLTAERDGAGSIRFPEALLQRAQDPEVGAILDGQRRIFQARAEALAGKRAILRQRIEQFRAEIDGLRGQITAQMERIALSDEEIRDNSGLLEKGMVGKQRMLELKRDALEVRGEHSKNVAAVARVEQSIAETRLEITDLDIERLNEVVQELRDVQAEAYDLREKIRAAEDVLRRTEIRAPIAGTVVGLAVHTVGGVIAPGEPLMDIVPAGERLIIEARVDPLDIDVVEPALAAHVRFTAFSQRGTRPVEGRVITVSADSLLDERTGESYYSARIELTGDLEEALGGEVLYPGMQAEVMIVTGTRTPLDYFIKPISDSFNRAFREQ